MSSKNLKIDSDNAGRRIDNYLFNIYKTLPKSKIYSMLRKGEPRVNSGRIKPAYKLQINDEIRIPPYLIEFKNDLSDLRIPSSMIKEFSLSRSNSFAPSTSATRSSSEYEQLIRILFIFSPIQRK